MRTRIKIASATLLGVVAFGACNDRPTEPQAVVAAARTAPHSKPVPRATLLTNVPVSGPLSDGGSFIGTFTATHLDVDETTRALSWSGILTGTATTADGVAHAVIDTVAGIPGTLAREATSTALVQPTAYATCDVLFLDLGQLHLDLLGLTVDLNEVVLDINAVTGSGNLLGNLLCALLGLLDGPGILASIGQILDSINAILGGLSGLGIGA